MTVLANNQRLTPFALWRSRLPASIGNWFARDLARVALELADAGRVTLRSVEGAKIEANVADKGGVSCAVEWATGTGPQALRSVCTCGSTGVCEHVVATLETVRRADEAPLPVDPADAEVDLTWLPASDLEAPRARARSVWPVISSTDGKVLTGALYLDTPRLRGVIRDAESILAMMESTPPDDWDNADRELIRDEAVQEAFGTRVSQRALARALFRLARHPRTRYDDEPGANRHPVELVPFDIDVRGLRLRAVREGDAFVPALERGNGERFTPKGALIVDGPPSWLVMDRVAYLLDDSFDAKRVVAAAAAVPAPSTGGNGKPAPSRRPSIGTIARVAPFLSAEDRHELGVVDAEAPAALAKLRWTDGALIARLAFIDRKSEASASFSVHGAVAATDGRFVRFSPATARTFAHRFLEAGFVPRGGDSFALHDVERAANFVRDVVGDWDDVDIVLDDSLSAVAAGESAIDVSISARPTDVEGERDWFELNVDVFVGDGTALTPKELTALLSSSGRYAEVRGKLFDVEELRKRRTLLAELNDRRRTGMAALVALHDEIHEAFGDVALPEEVEHLRERLRNFEGIPSIEPPTIVAGILRDYQRRGLDFLDYLRSFKFGGILADEMGLGKAAPLSSTILTPTGWQRFGDLKVGDEVMNAQGGISRVTGIFPQGTLEAFRVKFSDGATTLCSDEHLWQVNSPLRKSRGNPPRVLTLRAIRERLHDAAGNARHFIPVAEPMHFAQSVELPIEPYLLGCLLGDGSMTHREVRLSSADAELLEECRALLPTGTDLVPLKNYDYAIRTRVGSDGLRSDHAVRSALAELDLMGCGSATKFVPDPYLFAGISERLAVLQGLMDTDGSVSAKDNHVEFTSVSRELAESVMFLVRSLGGVARLRHKAKTTYTYTGETRIGKAAHRVSIVMPPQYNPFRLSRKADAYRGRVKYQPTRAIVDVVPEGECEMQCISVDAPDHLYITNDFIVTHNTLQVIAQLLHRKQEDGAAPALVIAPTSVTHTWESEIARFAPELSTLRLQSGAERATRYSELENYDVIITSYALARLDAEHLERFNFRTLILDEAQNAKNPSSQIAKVVRNLRADHRLALTGTPVENSLRDLWSIFAFVEPGLLGSEASFRRRFENPIAEGDDVAANQLRSRLEPFMLRRTKEDVARELPARTEQIIECDLSPLQRRLYRGIAEAARRDVIAHIDGEGGIEGATVHVLAALTRLRQVCAHPGLILPEYIDEPEASGKFDAFMETVEEVLSGGHKVLVFSAFASMLKIMRSAMVKREIPYGYLDGSTKDRDRQAEVERFMSADGPPVFLCSLKAGGVGLTLTAADYVILYDPWWNPAVERQAIDRTHRIGQKRPVTAYRMVTAGSVEEKIRALAERKSALSRSVIKADSAIAKSLTKDDLEFLFADPS